MGKVSIGLRGWRFDEADVFEEDGSMKPLSEMPPDVADRINRLTSLVGSPCDACWLVHGEEGLDACDPAEVVYGEPLAEVILCPDHEIDFLYWYRECGGRDHRGSEEFRDAFHEWFLDGGRAPEGYDGMEHVETDPADLPETTSVLGTSDGEDSPIERARERTLKRIDLREGEIREGEEAEREIENEPLDVEDVDLDADYPG